MIPKQIENPMVTDMLGFLKHRLPQAEFKPECECGCAAKIKINGEFRCWECAEDEGVERI
jgi:hypothetical protein